MEGSSLTPFAWFFMLTSMLAVTALVVYCYKRILFDRRDKPAEVVRGPSDDAPAAGG